MAGWLLLTVLICLHSQLSSIIHSIIMYYEYRCLKNFITVKMNGCSFQLLPAKFGLVFVLPPENDFSLEVSF